jgi:hypothetical protein
VPCFGCTASFLRNCLGLLATLTASPTVRGHIACSKVVQVCAIQQAFLV